QGRHGSAVAVAGFVAAQRAEYGVPHVLACRALGVSPAWFYKWRHGDGSPRRARRRALAALIAALFAQHRGTYGAPRITADLTERGWLVSQNTVAAPPEHHPPWQGPLARPGPGQTRLHGSAGESARVRRWHR